jgi:hypothetical protein
VLWALSAIIRWTLRRLALDEQAFARRRVTIGASGTKRDHPLDIMTPRPWEPGTARGDESQSVLRALSAIIRWISRRLALVEQARRGDESQSALRAPSAIIRWISRRLALVEQARRGDESQSVRMALSAIMR